MDDNKMTSMELRATWGLGIVFSLRMMGMFMVLPVLTTYGLALQGASNALIGLAIGIYGLAQAIFQIPFGLLSDRIGRKALIVIGLLIFVLGSVIAATTSSIWGVILGRALQGSGAIAAAIMALLSDLTREQNRTKAMAFIGISFGITFAIAMILGPIITHAIGLHALFWMIALQASCGIIITLLVVPSTSQHVLNRESGIVKDSIREVLTDGSLVKLNVGIFCLHTLLMSSFVALPSQFEYAGLPASEHWKVYLYTMLIAFAFMLPFIVYAEAKRRIKKVFVSYVMLILIAEVILWAAGNHFWILVMGVQLFFIGFNLMEAVLPSIVSKESPPGYKGTAMGLYSTSQFIGMAIGGGMGGWIFDHIDARSVFLFGAMIAFVWLLVSLRMQEPPYVSSLRLTLEYCTMTHSELEKKLNAHPGVSAVFIVPEEKSAYVKIDGKITNRAALEKLISAA